MKRPNKIYQFSKISKNEKISKKPRRQRIESLIQQSIIQYSNITTIKNIRLSNYLIAIPNGGSRNLIEAARLKREGVKAGVLDLFFAYPTDKYHGLWIEIKKPDKSSKMTIGQKEWFERMLTIGYNCILIRSYDEFKEAIYEYLGVKSTSIC